MERRYAKSIRRLDQQETRLRKSYSKYPATDRRENALYITAAGRQILQRLGAIARAHDDATCDGLSPEERAQLSSLLERIARRQGLARGVHPGYRTLRPRPDVPPK